MQKYTNGYGEEVTRIEAGDRVLFQSAKYPDLAPYAVTVRSIHPQLIENGKPYLSYVTDSGDISQPYPQSCFTITA